MPSATITDSFCLVEELEHLRRQIAAQRALSLPEPPRSAFDAVADDARVTAEELARIDTRLDDTTAVDTTPLDNVRAHIQQQHAQLLAQLDGYEQWAEYQAGQVAARRRARIALWIAPILAPIAFLIYFVIKPGSTLVTNMFWIVVFCAAWGGLGSLFYHQLQKRSAAAVADGTQNPDGTVAQAPTPFPDRPPLAAACSVAAMFALPILVFGGCFIIPIGILIVVAVIFLKD